MGDDDLNLWKAVAETVRPLTSKKAPSSYKAKYVSLKKKLTVKAEHSAHDVDLDLSIRKELKAGDVQAMDKSTAQKFKNGEMPIEGVLDLHGYTMDKAREALFKFIRSHSMKGSRCLLLITGKGGLLGRGVLRSELPSWMNDAEIRSLILSYVSAKPKDGGEGAFYILLKRRRK